MSEDFDSLKLAMDYAVSLRSAVVLLGRFPALSGADFSVERGEIVVVRGANGAGKTTLLRLCAGLVALYAGEGEVLGYDLRETGSAAKDWRSRVGFLGHETRLYGDLTAKENVEFALALSGRAALSARAQRGRGLRGGVLHSRELRHSTATRPPSVAASALERLELAERLHHERVSCLSAGQQRRVALACVSVRRPELWLLDEPHASLDADGRKCVDDVIAEAATAGAAVIVVTHEQSKVFDNLRTATLAGGRFMESLP